MDMSAFLVEDATINKIVTWLRREISTGDRATLDQLAMKYHLNIMSDMWDEKLANAMWQLNCASVDARYGEGTAKGERTKPFQFMPEPYFSLVEVYKALQCWSYQCCEGDIPETSKFYTFFSEIENYLARKIVMALPEYDKAEWG